jgi:26S proteasome regulatory subunit N5
MASHGTCSSFAVFKWAFEHFHLNLSAMLFQFICGFSPFFKFISLETPFSIVVFLLFPIFCNLFPQQHKVEFFIMSEKMQVDDQSAVVDAALSASGNLPLDAAIEHLLHAEKTARLANDTASTSRLAIAILQRCRKERAWDVLYENISVLAKRRGQFKQTLQAMVQEASSYLDSVSDAEMDTPRKKQLIAVLESVCEGKIHVELERAALIQRLARMKENEGDLAGAAETIQEVAIETVGSMEKRAKIEYILEQLRLVLLHGDYVRAGILSKKVTKKALEDQDDDIKIRYYELLLKVLQHQKSHLESAKAFFETYSTQRVKNNPTERRRILYAMVGALVLAKHDNDSVDMAHRLAADRVLQDDTPELKLLLDGFLGTEILDGNMVFGLVRDSDVHKRVVEHNIRVLAQYYTRCTLDRLGQLLHLAPEEAERALCEMVSNKEVWARVDRLSGVVVFARPEEPNEALDAWAGRVSEVFHLVDRANHLIHKENMVHKIV